MIFFMHIAMFTSCNEAHVSLYQWFSDGEYWRTARRIRKGYLLHTCLYILTLYRVKIEHEYKKIHGIFFPEN